MGRQLGNTDSFDVRRHLRTVFIFGFLDFTVCFEIDHRPAIECRGILLESEVDHAFYEGAIVPVVLKGCFPSQHLRSCRPLQQRVLQGAARCCDGGINLSGRGIHERRVGLRCRADFVGARSKIHCGKHSMNEHAEAASAWSLDIGT